MQPDVKGYREETHVFSTPRGTHCYSTSAAENFVSEYKGNGESDRQGNRGPSKHVTGAQPVAETRG